MNQELVNKLRRLIFEKMALQTSNIEMSEDEKRAARLGVAAAITFIANSPYTIVEKAAWKRMTEEKESMERLLASLNLPSPRKSEPCNAS